MSATTSAGELRRLPLFDETLLSRDGAGEPSLVGWRCDSCGRLAFGRKRICPICGATGGRETQLRRVGRLETWTTVSTKQGTYDIAYAMLNDGEDEQEVRVFGPIVAADIDGLEIGQQVSVEFDHSEIAGVDSVHHAFSADGPTGGQG